MDKNTNSPADSHAVDQISFLHMLKKFFTYKLIVLSLLAFGIGVLIVYFCFGKSGTSLAYYILNEIGKAVFITAIVAGAIKWHMAREYDIIKKQKDGLIKHDLSETIENLQKDISAQTANITACSQSLDAMNSCDVSRLFRNRVKSSEEIKSVISEMSFSELKVIGISLNDFVRDENRTLHSAWKIIESRIQSSKSDTEAQNKIVVRVMIIDPLSKGAYLRSTAEEQQGKKDRLLGDVDYSVKYFMELEEKSKDSAIDLKVRLYRLPPILYLVWTPEVAFFHHYHFRPTHSSDINIPVQKIINRSYRGETEHKMHDELNFHFEWIWDKASISLVDYMNNCSEGTDKCIRKANISNMFYDQSSSRKRIQYLIRKTDHILWIKGITLKSFFDYGELFDDIADCCSNKTLDIKILIINPKSEQAKYRSFREYLISNKEISIDNFDDELRKEQRLYKEIRETFRRILDFIDELKEKTANLKISVNFFNSSTESFSLITDDFVVLEQYHYGMVKPGGPNKIKRRILGGNFPVIEYKRKGTSEDTVDDPFSLMKDHFNFTFKHCSFSPTREFFNAEQSHSL